MTITSQQDIKMLFKKVPTSREKKIIVRHLKTEWSCFLKKQERDPCNFFRVKELKQTNDNFILF